MSAHHGSRTEKRTVGRKRKPQNDSSSGVSRKYIKVANKKYIEEIKRKTEFPPTFIYSKFINIVKKNFKDFFLESKDLIQNNNGEINQKNKGSKKSLSLGAYEFGEGYFDLKFDGKIGIRTSAPSKDRRSRTPSSNIVKANHFWWLISKAFLNKYLLEDARDTVKEFVDQTQHGADSKEKQLKIEGLFDKD